LESKSFFLKLSNSKLSIIIIALVFVLSAFSIYYLLSEFGPVYFIEATKLDEKPEKYFPFSNLDSYGIQTIFDENFIDVEIGLDVFSEILEMQNSLGTKNVEYSNNYYEVQLLSGDRFPPVPYLFPFTSLLISGILIIGIFIVKIKPYFIKK